MLGTVSTLNCREQSLWLYLKPSYRLFRLARFMPSHTKLTPLTKPQCSFVFYYFTDAQQLLLYLRYFGKKKSSSIFPYEELLCDL